MFSHDRRQRHRGRARADLHEEHIERLRGFFSHGRGGRSVRRGNVRNAIVSMLAEHPMHGYQLITELETRTAGRWRPSAGSIYPTLQLLEDEGLVTSDVVEGRRTYTLTDSGRSAAAETADAGLPWLDPNVAADALDLRKQAMGLIGAAVQVRRVGSPKANQAAGEILSDARRRLYALLAEDGAEADA